MSDEIDLCCLGLDSTKVTERRKYAENLKELLNKSEIVNILNSNTSYRSWDHLYTAVHRFLKKEAEKLYENEIKQKSTSRPTTVRARNSYHPLLPLVVSKANLGEPKLSVVKLIESVIQCFDCHYHKKYYGDVYLTVLVKHTLSIKKYWGAIDDNRWQEIYYCLKELYKDISNYDKEYLIRGLFLTIKYGSLHSSLNYVLRQEFVFIKSLCSQLQTNTSFSLQENILQVLIAFTVQLSTECRMACCKLGEEISPNLIDLYEPRFEKFGGKKSLIFDFLLLQIRLHHPGGDLEGSDAAYAYDWTKWKTILRSLYSILLKEIDVVLRDYNSNSINNIPEFWPNFLALCVEITRQIFCSGVQDVTQASVLLQFEEVSQVAKRPRLETGLPAVISAIQTKDNWPWLCILSELLSAYPETLQPNEFLFVLDVLVNIQSECKISSTRHYLYKLLSKMAEIQVQFEDVQFDLERMESLWTKIGETTLRSVGLNHNEDTIHKNLQMLLQNKIGPQPLDLLSIYTSGVLNISSYSLQTLYILLKIIPLPEFNPTKPEMIIRSYLISYILGNSNEKMVNMSVYAEEVTGRVLVGLVLKTWPYQIEINQNELSKRMFKFIEDSYILSSFEGGLLCQKTEEKISEKQYIYLIHSNALNDLLKNLKIFSDRLEESETSDLINGLILILNVLSNLLHFNIYSKQKFYDFLNINKLFQCLNKSVCEKTVDISILRNLEKLFHCKLHPIVAELLREEISVDFLKVLFDLTVVDEVDGTDDMDDKPSTSTVDLKLNSSSSSSLSRENSLSDKELITLTAVRVLILYCCVPEASAMTQQQKFVLETLANPDFDPNSNIDFEITICIIKSLSLCKIGTISDSTVDFILKSLQNLMEARYQNFEDALLLLQILKDQIPHIYNSELNQNKKNCLSLLEPFYEKKDSYGFALSETLADCMGNIIKYNSIKTCEETKNIMLKLIGFLKSCYHQVRLSSIKNILNIFLCTTNVSKTFLSLQNKILEEINKKVLESFIINNDLNPEQSIDEAANRTASALHMFAALIASNSIWRKKALYFFFHLIYEKKIHISLIQKVLDMIGKHLEVKSIEDFLETNINFLLCQWNKNNHHISSFPFQLFRCETEVKFLAKYIKFVIPMLLQQNSTDILKEVCQEMNKTMTDILKESYPNFMAQFLPIYVVGKPTDCYSITNEDVLLAKKIFKQLNEILNCDYDSSLLVSKLDEVMIHLLDRIFDPEHFKNQFNLDQVLPEPDPPFFSYELFQLTLSYLEKKLSTNSLISYCIKNCPNKLEQILLSTKINFDNSLTLEDKLTSLYKYSILVDYISEELQNCNELNTFLIRSITYTLINLIRFNKDKFELLSIAACRFFKKFCAKSLPTCAKTFEKFLILIVSTLVQIAKSQTDLSVECVLTLNFLIVQKSKSLYSAIGSLDPFPNDPKFGEIQEVYQKIKYGNDSFSLEQEIRHFLNIGNVLDDRTEGLQHLKLQLCNKKEELAVMYKNLHKLRGFCQDCKNSILHQLICMLIKLTSSTNLQVRLEAARCLGELGPTNLTTLVLKTEETEDNISDPLTEVTEKILSLLSQNLVSHEAKVAKAISDALYSVLSSKEGYQITTKNDRRNFEQTFLTPFLPAKKPSKSTSIQINERDFCNLLNQSDLWCPTAHFPHSDWIISLVSELLRNFPEKCFLRSLIPVCQVNMEFAEEMLPLTIFLILCQNKKGCTNLISKQIERFFANHWQGTMANKSSLSQASTDSMIVFNRASVQCMLNVIHYIRLQQNAYSDKLEIDELQVNFLHVAQGAQFCSAYFTSILYSELWCYNKMEEKQLNVQSNSSTLENVCKNQESNLSQVFENMLRNAYKKIGDIDAMYGCGTSYILNLKSQIDYYRNIGRWDKIILPYDTQYSFDPRMTSCDFINALKNNSLHSLALNVKSEDITHQYECAWRLNQWNFTNLTIDNQSSDYEKHHYLALKCLHESDFGGMKEAICQGRISVINDLAHASLESSKSLYGALTKLQMLQEVEDFYQAKTELNLVELLEKWKNLNDLNKNEFEYIEPIKSQRITMLSDIFTNTSEELVKSSLVDMHLQLVNEARTENFHHVAHRSLNNLSYIPHLTQEMKSRILFEQAQLSWIDDKNSGRCLLKYLLEKNNTLSLQMYGLALKLYGNWMVETRSENPQSIIENYFEKSLEIFSDIGESGKDIENHCETLDSYARYVDAQYQQVTNYISSPSFESKIHTMKKFRNMAENLKQPSNSKSSDERKAIALYEKQSQIDESEVNNAFKEKDMYLNLAVVNYLRILELCDSYNLKLFRILSLALENKANKDLLQTLKQYFPLISSYKYIPLLPQLVPHIGNQNDLFEKIIQDLLERCAVDHPHHTLPIILALADSYKDRTFDETCSSESAETRVQIAKDLINRLKKQKNLTQIINNMEIVSNSLISLAYVDANKCKTSNNDFIIPKKEKIGSIRGLDNVLIPTINLELSKSRNYENIIGIHEFSKSFSLVGGINAPKKITCFGTDGILRTQLVKGKDDLRQDAVMQQVFSIMNTLLAKNKQTSKLFIRTYKVVPLSQRSGVIEWCENTEPLGSYLNNAHKRYHPKDMTPSEARNLLKNVHNKDYSIKYKKFQEVCSKLRPVFHMFFISTYPQPTVWFEKRRAYMLSVATSSMVGYILGLGDRHVQNILLDVSTAEVVHIDFGIAFEQGRVLPTPETVPFRLTRDIEAGMGICGIEGVFRRSCEKTMQVLRQNSETVLTILEVLLYDPLYVWTITPAEAYSRQRDDDVQQNYNFSDDDATPVNVAAERALLRLKQKLQGIENGDVYSVEGQVRYLLQQAKDPVNLSRLYNGWQAYL